MPQFSVTFANALKSEPAATVSIAEGTTLRQLLSTQGGVPDNATVYVNRLAFDLDRALPNGAYVTVSPSQVKGA